jgi:hypothetical protein
MLLLAATIAASAPQLLPRAVAPAVQARATVRIVSGVRLSLGKERSRDGFVARDTTVRTAGSVEPARLIEFE